MLAIHAQCAGPTCRYSSGTPVSSLRALRFSRLMHFSGEARRYTSPFGTSVGRDSRMGLCAGIPGGYRRLQGVKKGVQGCAEAASEARAEQGMSSGGRNPHR